MSSFTVFDLSSTVSDNMITGSDFDLQKRNPIKDSIVGYDQRMFQYKSNDRFVPTRRFTNSEFLKKTRSNNFDISSSDNDLKTIRKVRYQNELRKLFLDLNDPDSDKENKKEEGPKIKLIHTDWACKIHDLRLKFLPDFETVKKPRFGSITNYIWSSKQLIAAASNRNICLYHPFNGFTRALDVTDHTCMAFSHSGDLLALAYRKSRRRQSEQDLYVFEIDHKNLFDSEKLNTEKVRTSTPFDVTALCYTRNDEYLMCGTDVGKIIVIKCVSPNEKLPPTIAHTWIFATTLTTSYHKNEIKKICFSANFRYMASLDLDGQLVIWNGGLWTFLFCIQKENSKLYKHLEWHPFVEEELIFGSSRNASLYLVNVVQKKSVACYENWNHNIEISSIAFNPVTAQLAVCFYMRDDFINRVTILASMSQVLCTFDFDYIRGGLKLIWNPSGTMLGAGAQCFRFAFWSFQKKRDLSSLMIKGSNKTNPILFTMNGSKLNNLR
ncbi:CLUMA_CG002202, isoform A [Clunio marinus]|uniref:CLUMA_CG002202, isoform A n=1 Tax=Clunio marinus TaxID=568069 RepID=A0A1J1HLX2_9DIPT|nr:CLUMA_CG002202, isoform A [Clunio marinus]